MDIGRNDPCPCGSGKKYKKCCGLLDQDISPADSRFTQISQTQSAIKIKLEQYHRGTIRQMRSESLERFLGYTVKKRLTPELESIFSDWLWFDVTGEEDMTLAQLYWQNNNKYMDTWLKLNWTALINSYLSIYTVESVQDITLNITDVFSGTLNSVLLAEPFALPADQEWLSLGRLVRLEPDQVFSGMVLMSEFFAPAKDYLAEVKPHFADLSPTETGNFLKCNGEMVVGWFDHIMKIQESD